MPDYFVPLDTTLYTKYHRELSAKTVIRDVNLKYVLANRKQLQEQYESFEKFKQEYEIPQSVIDNVIAEGEKKKIKPKDDNELQQTMPQLRMQLKALVARDLWDMNEYFSVFNESDAIVQKALSELGR